MQRQHISQTKSAIAPPQPESAIARSSTHPIEELQGAIGNRAVNRLLANQPVLQAKPMFKGLSGELRSPIQPKLTIGAVGDRYEQEADRIAAQVVNRIHAPQFSQQGATIQRQETNEEYDKLQMKPVWQHPFAGIPATPGLEAEIGRSRDNGQPLAASIRKPMEQAFGADFSGVRVHTDAQSDRLNRSIQAEAFTTEKDIFFRQEAYHPSSRSGQELVAHELAHVVQQGKVQLQQRQDSSLVVPELTSKSLMSNSIQLKPEKAMVKREAEKDAGIHKSNRKQLFRGQKATVRRGGLFKTGIKERIADDTVILVDYERSDNTGRYIWAKYNNTAGREKEGYINKDYVISLNQLDSNQENSEKLKSNLKFRNKHQREILKETSTFLGAIGAYDQGPFERPASDENLTVEEFDKENFEKPAVTSLTSPERLSKKQRRFLAGTSKHSAQNMKIKDTYERGFIIRYQDYPNRFRAIVELGRPLLWTLDIHNILSIGSPNNNKHAVVAGGKDVIAAGEAKLKSAIEQYQETGEISDAQIRLWEDITQKQSEIETYQKLGWKGGGYKSPESFDSAIEKLNQQKEELIEQIGGQETFDLIDKNQNEPASEENKALIIDFGSGHYAPRKAWSAATAAWKQAGFKVEWNTKSPWV